MSVPSSYRVPLDLDALLAESPFLADLGLEFLSLDSSGAVFELAIAPRHSNAEKRMHGGVIASMLDAACGLPVRFIAEGTDLVRAVTLTLSISYIAAPKGPRVRATGRVTGGGRSVVFSEGEVRDLDGSLVATATGSFKRLRPAQPDQTFKESS
ncbi:PaaI family thioesterase [Salipiger sp. P9]|uniref:PaaI family thioesterase n=1 Tax=Salipiger pentaromativorans TaxID=2943193 RepID=UPI0021579922|nr:PaaI family thioesterase [Salipiger pentaromativorans]MCR8551021.1 PaaI family thioesterase [Salipiger pentaromativorans]